jgi:capsular polysaccharide biosynthesis protein
VRNGKYFLSSLVFIVLISKLGGFFAEKVEQNSGVLYQAFLPFKLKDQRPNKEVIDNIRYLLLYENNIIEQLSKDFKLSSDIIAGNLKILMENDQMHFTIAFKFRDKKVAEEIIQQTSKIIQKKQPDIEQTGAVIVTRLAKQKAKSKLIGLVVGFFFSAGIIAMFFDKRK